MKNSCRWINDHNKRTNINILRKDNSYKCLIIGAIFGGGILFD